MQEAAVDKLVELHGKSVSRAMRESKHPYSPKTAKNPKNLTESKGFEDLLKKYGLTQGFITRALVSDIKAKPKKRFFELNLGAEILGMKEHGSSGGNKTLVVVIAGESANRYAVQTSQNAS